MSKICRHFSSSEVLMNVMYWRKLAAFRRLHISDFNTFDIMCDIPSSIVFSSISTECFPSMSCKFFFKPSVTIPVAPIITGMIIHFMFHIHWISIHKLFHYFLFAPFCMTFLSTGIGTSISTHVSSLLFVIICHNFSIIVIIIVIVVIVITTTCILWQYQLFTVICLHVQISCISVFL